MTTKEKTTVALYARVSSDRQQRAETIKSQRDTNNKYAKARGYQVFECYQDDGISGAAELEKREGLNSLLAAAKGNFSRVICWDWNRLGRRDDFELLVQLSQSGIHEIEESSTGALHDLKTFTGKLLSAVKTLMASQERKELAEKVKRGKDYKLREEGIWLGLPPFGYSLDETRKQFSYNETEKALAERIFQMSLVDGMSVRAISDTLYREGERWRKDKVITPQIIRYCFRNECYCGSLFANRYRSVDGRRAGERPRSEWIEFQVPPMISRQTHNQLLRRLKNLRKTGRPATPGRYLFQGLLK